MDDEMYREHILDLYRSPHNFGRLAHPDREHRSSNAVCGDDLTLQASVKGGRLSDIRFSGRGCAISMASASLITDKAKGMTIKQAMALGKDDILELLQIPLSPVRLKCALLPLEALQQAIGEHHGDA
ncbi:MAG: iron-sulfur cluster assembly scaffold protein [Nanoarchaeota archaeon]